MQANILVVIGFIFSLSALCNDVSILAQTTWPSRVETALQQAGDNRVELEKLLMAYRKKGDPLKFQAACFLIENMPGHCYVETGLLDQHGNEVAFDALQYQSLGEAKQALAKLEAQYGPLKFGRTKVTNDIENIRGDYLSSNIESAFQTWRANPWTRELTFETFCEHILPYRATNEPIEDWRDDCKIELTSILDKLTDVSSWTEAASAISRLTKHHVNFDQLYYMHPTDQGFAQLCKKPIGRCEDQQTMQIYVMRANGIAVAGDFTPYWANRDNNHAWEVLLDEKGQGHAGLFNVAAKVYRKGYSHNLENLFFKNGGGDGIPKWLSGRTFRDVTDQYMTTSNVSIELNEPTPNGIRFAYICVFNGGEWKSIHWCNCVNKQATFSNMGQNVLYLPAYFVEDSIVPAASPFILDKKGESVQLSANFDLLEQKQLSKVAPAIKDDDLKTEFPEEKTVAGANYEIMVWNNGWQSLGKHIVDPGDSAVISRLPVGGLYWMVSDTNRETARPFTIDDGKPRYW